MMISAKYQITRRRCVEVSPERPMMERVCAWCKSDMEPVPCEPAQAGKITHGMCAGCALKIMEDRK